VGHIRPNCCQLNSPRTWKDAHKKNKEVEKDSKLKYVLHIRDYPLTGLSLSAIIVA